MPRKVSSFLLVIFFILLICSVLLFVFVFVLLSDLLWFFDDLFLTESRQPRPYLD